MTFDPTKMDSQEWHATKGFPPSYFITAGNKVIGTFDNQADCEESVMLHNERLIAERRRWFVMPWGGLGWVVAHTDDCIPLLRHDGTKFNGPHSIWLLTEADAYFKRKDGK